MKPSDSNQTIILFYVDGYIYYQETQNSWVCAEGSFETESDIADLGLNLTELENLKPTVKDLDNGKYKIDIKKKDLNKIIVRALDGFGVVDVSFGDMTIYVWLDLNTGFLTKMEYISTFSINKTNFSMSAKIEINAINDKVINDYVLNRQTEKIDLEIYQDIQFDNM